MATRFSRHAGGRPPDAARNGLGSARRHRPQNLRQHCRDDRVPARRGDHVGRGRIEAGLDDELEGDFTPVRAPDHTLVLAGVADLRDQVGGVGEAVLEEAALRPAVHGFEHHVVKKPAGIGVPGNPGRAKLETVRESPVDEDDIGGAVRHAQVHRAMFPGSVRVRQRSLGFEGGGCRPGILEAIGVDWPHQGRYEQQTPCAVRSPGMSSATSPERRSVQ